VLPSCSKAWGTQDETAFLRRIAGKNPPELAEKLENIPYFIAHGDSDSAVPLEDHSLRLAQRLGENVHLQVIPGGEHGTGDLRYLETMPQRALRAYLELLRS
jgi:pimeloyl-ACP methyl ester carboxylesterase